MTRHYSLLTTHYSQLTTHYSLLLTTHYSLLPPTAAYHCYLLSADDSDQLADDLVAGGGATAPSSPWRGGAGAPTGLSSVYEPIREPSAARTAWQRVRLKSSNVGTLLLPHDDAPAAHGVVSTGHVDAARDTELARASSSLGNGKYVATCYLLLPSDYLLTTDYRCTYLLLPTYYLLLFTAYYPLPTTYYLLFTAYCILLTIYYLLHTSYFLLLTTYCLLPTTYYLLRMSSFLSNGRLQKVWDSKWSR